MVPGYPDRLLPGDDAAAEVLKKRTLTNLYNQRPAWLDHAHAGSTKRWPRPTAGATTGAPAGSTDDEILARLFALNQARAAGSPINLHESQSFSYAIAGNCRVLIRRCAPRRPMCRLRRP